MAALPAVLKHPSISPLADERVEDLDLSGLDELTRERILRTSARRARPLTLERALRTLGRRDRERLSAWLLTLASNAGPPSPSPERAPGPELHGGMPEEALEAWAEIRGLTWALDLGLPMVDRWAGHVSMAEAVCTSPRDRRAWWFSPALQDQALDFLREREVAAQEAVAHVARHRVRWLQPPANPALRPLWEAARDAFLAAGEVVPHTLLVDDDSLEVMADPPGIVVEVLGHRWELAAERDQLELPTHPALSGACAVALLEQAHDPHPALLRALQTPRWQRDLEFLDRAAEVPELPESEDKRLLGWELVEHEGQIELSPVQCRWTRKGSLQCRRVAPREVPAALLSQEVDRRVVAMLEDRFQRSPELCLAALSQLAGHPLVVRKIDTMREPIEVRSGTLQLQIERGAQGTLAWSFRAGGRPLDPDALHQAMSRRWCASSRVAVLQGHEVVVVQCTPEERHFAKAWIERRAVLPSSALGPLLARLPTLQRTIGIQLSEELQGTVVEGDPRPLFRATFRKGGLVVEARIQPAPDAPSHVPGEGPDRLHLVREGAPACVVRDRAGEPTRVRDLSAQLGLTDVHAQRPFVWAIGELGPALEVVRQLQAGEHRLEVDGSLPQVALGALADLNLDVHSQRDWVAVGGQLETELGTVALAQLMAAIDEGRDYVQVSKNVYVRLEEALSAQLGALSDQQQGDGLSLHGVHAPMLQGLESAGATVSGQGAWRELMARIRAAAALEAEVPAALQATLRDYQGAGFRWLASLAEWAPGAVLADDMGLGKTVQAIALLLRRIGEGPALVVAPTSVVFNWCHELERFAPSLQVVRYAGPDRGALLEGLGAGTVVLCSWSILQRDAEALAGVAWGTTVLDEAQAIKNPASKRAKAAVGLESGFRLALSGTPVENKAEELWSLFAAIVPGLLGSLASFRDRFGTGLPHTRAALARLVAPFLLRRTKRQVATDLPARTELQEPIPLSAAHRALYLRARAEALVRIQEAPPLKRRFLILSQLTRLRQLACDPRLVDASSPVPGTKVARLLEQLEEVRGAGAQALVFSSFVRHLELAREACGQAGLSVAWLTGSVPAEERQAEVARFQRGEADVFLISLKAGGTGLNLTAASYVFHLDPWWNPASEDQATDRAHRIGQTNPVTVYRMVAVGTIEEQILALHAEKRDLVDALMAGSGSALPVGADELMALLADPMGEPAEELPPTQELPTPATGGLAAFLADAEAELEAASLAPSSRYSYVRGLHQFVQWCEASGVTEPASIATAVPAYLAAAEAGHVARSRGLILRAAWARVGHLCGGGNT